MARIAWFLALHTVLVLALTGYARAQNVTYHLHSEPSSTLNHFQLKTAGPDVASQVVLSADLKGAAVGEKPVKEFDTQAGEPSASGIISTGSTISFTLWMKKTANVGTLFPRAKLKLDNANGVTFCTATGTSALTTTLVKYTLSCTTTANVTLTPSNRLYVWVGVNLTAKGTSTFKAELDVEGTSGGNYDSMVVLPQLAPNISSLSPAAGPVGRSVTINGSNFGTSQGSNTVKFNGVTATPTRWSATGIDAPVPVSATTGAVVVTVGTLTSNGPTFTVGPTGTIAGTILRGSDGTAISGAQVTASQAGTVKGSAASAANGAYTISDLPAGTYDVTAASTGLDTQTRSATVTAPSTTTLNFSLSTSLTYVYDELGRVISVVNPAGETVTYNYDAVGNLLSIIRRSSSQISISEFTPNAGPVGKAVTIYGTGFSATPSQNTVKFNGTTAVVTNATATRLTTSVPTGATTGPISVTAPSGTATSAAAFTVGTVNAAPTITSFTPRVGNANTSVTISGTNFETIPTNNKVVFNINRASVSASTATSITAAVPSVTGSGRIYVETPSGKVTSSGDFYIPPPDYSGAPIDLNFTGRMTIGETKVFSNSFSAVQEYGLLLFDGVAGQRISVKLSNITIPSGYWALYSANGVSLSGLRYFEAGGGGLMEPVVIPVTGTQQFYLDVNGNGLTVGATRSITFNIYVVPPDVTGSLTAASPTPVSLTTPGQNAEFTFNGVAGQRVSLKLTGSTIPEYNVLVRQPDTLLVGSGYYATGDSFMEPVTLAVNGAYKVQLDPSGPNTGNVTLTLYDVPADTTGTLVLGGAAVPVATTAPGQNATVSFNATAGQQATVNIINNSTGAVTVTLLKPELDGTYTALTSTTSSSSSFSLTTQTLPVTGLYKISIDPSGPNTGSMNVNVANP